MAAWIIAALSLLGTLGGERGIPGLPAAIDPFEAGGLQLPGVSVGDIRRRRRRRRALSQGDRDDISFIAATINPTVAGKFAVALATRSR